MTLSIIVPVYNLEKYIATTLDSLLNINCSFDYEIVVINDGSTDQSEKIVKKYREKRKCIRLYTIENKGVSNARNFGISKAMGKYITFIDGDDTVYPDFFEVAVNELENGHYDFVQGNFEIIENNRILMQQHVNQDLIIDKKYELFKHFFYPHKKIIHNTVWGKVYKSELLKNTYFDKTLKVAEDQKYIFDLLLQVKKIKLIARSGVKYVQRDTSAMHIVSEDKIKDKISVLDYCKEKIMYSDIKMYIDWHKLDALVELYRYYILNGSNTCTTVYYTICETNNKMLRRFNSKKTNILLWVLIHIRQIYIYYIKRKGSSLTSRME